MKISVIKMMLPVFAFAIATAGAVGSMEKTSKKVTVEVQGWKRIAPFDCEPVRMCNNEGDAICVDGTDQLYGKPTPSSDCVQILTHRL